MARGFVSTTARTERSRGDAVGVSLSTRERSGIGFRAAGDGTGVLRCDVGALTLRDSGPQTPIRTCMSGASDWQGDASRRTWARQGGLAYGAALPSSASISASSWSTSISRMMQIISSVIRSRADRCVKAVLFPMASINTLHVVGTVRPRRVTCSGHPFRTVPRAISPASYPARPLLPHAACSASPAAVRALAIGFAGLGDRISSRAPVRIEPCSLRIIPRTCVCGCSCAFRAEAPGSAARSHCFTRSSVTCSARWPCLTSASSHSSRTSKNVSAAAPAADASAIALHPHAPAAAVRRPEDGTRSGRAHVRHDLSQAQATVKAARALHAGGCDDSHRAKCRLPLSAFLHFVREVCTPGRVRCARSRTLANRRGPTSPAVPTQPTSAGC